VIDAPLSTSAMVGVCIGAALYGMRPVCEIQFAGFIHPAFNQIVNEAAKIHYRSCGEWHIPLVIRAPYGGGVGGGLYHSQSVEAFFTHVPGLKVVIPSNPYDARGLLKCAIADPNPVLFLEPLKGYRSVEEDIPEGSYTVPIGKARVSRPGTSISVFSYGMMHQYALAAAEKVALEGIDAEVVDLRTLYPLDKDTVLASVLKTNRALIIHEDNLTGGYGAEVAAYLADEAFAHLDAPVRRLAGPDVPGIPFSYPMQEWYMPNPEKIAAAMRELHAY
jgi:2-oxoisovalerate dehydrogenase E1 component beta subunit